MKISPFFSNARLAFSLHKKGLLHKSPPSHWKKGEKGSVILLPGFGEPWTFLQTIAEDLNKLGYAIHVEQKLTYNFHSLEKSVFLLKTYIEEQKLKNVILLSHSKGGLIAKQYMDTFTDNNISLSISIATPYHGTPLAYLWIFSLKELTPNSQAIKQILNNTKNNHKILNIYAKVDSIIASSKKPVLQGAENILIDVIGHTNILEHKQTHATIRTFLKTRRM